MAKQYTCSISQELMVDPVLAKDGNTYDREGIEQWLQTHTTSPLDPSCRLSIKGLIPNRAVREAVEALVESGELDDDTCAAWREKKRAMDLRQAKVLYRAGRVLDAAKLGLPEAQGEMAIRCFCGSEGVEKDLDKCFEWATKAAEGGDKSGQFRLGYAYSQGEGVEKNWVEAIKWWELAAAQGCAVPMRNIGCIHNEGGFGVDQNFELAFSWYLKAADAGYEDAYYKVGQCLYKGLGVAKDLVSARTWFQKANRGGDVDGKFMLGFMMMRGEGGLKVFGAGMTLIEESAKDRSLEAVELLKKLEATIVSHVA
jgi:TPR repeat protein